MFLSPAFLLLGGMAEPRAFGGAFRTIQLHQILSQPATLNKMKTKIYYEENSQSMEERKACRKRVKRIQAQIRMCNVGKGEAAQ